MSDYTRSRPLLVRLRRDGRVVDRDGLENHWAARSPGFESLSLRQYRLKKVQKKSSLQSGCLFAYHEANQPEGLYFSL